MPNYRYRRWGYDNLGRFSRGVLRQDFLNTGRKAAKFLVNPSMAMYGAPAAAAAIGAMRTKSSKQSVSGPGGAAPLRGRRDRKKPKSKYCKGIRGKASKEICSLKNQMKELKYSENASLGHKTYRAFSAATHRSTAFNKQATSAVIGNNKTLLESAITTMAVYDSATNAWVQNNFNTGSNQRKVLFKDVSTKLTLRNNYISDCSVKVYLCKPKSDTDQTPLQVWNAGITDSSTTVGNSQTLYQYPSDYEIFKDIYSSKVLCNKHLSPGESVDVSHSVNNIEFDPATVDQQGEAYQKRWKSFVFLVVVSPTIGHDATNASTLQCGVDMLIVQTAKMEYNAGSNINTIEVADTLATLTTPVQSHQPIADNQNYSTT